MHARSDRGPARAGHAAILAGVVGFLVGSFLPFYDLELTNESPSFARQMLTGLPETPGWGVGGILMLFAATAVVGVMAAIGLGAGARDCVTQTTVGAAATWSITWVGALLRSTGFSVEIGFFVMWVGIGAVVVGTVIVIGQTRRTSVRGSDPSPSDVRGSV
jgi:hypothetical protein